MGVCALVHVPGVREGALSARLSAAGCQRVGRWRTHCLYLKPKGDTPADALAVSKGGAVPQPQLEPPAEEVCVLQFSERPGSHFVVRGGDVRESAGDLAGAEVSMRSSHTQRLRITAEGPEYLCGDFTVRIGGLFLNASVAGTIVEVEYLPCSLAGHAELVLRDFVAATLEAEASFLIESAAPRAEGLPRSFGRGHAALQFVRLLRSTKLVQLCPDVAEAQAELERVYREGHRAAGRLPEDERRLSGAAGGVRPVGGAVSEESVVVEGVAQPVRTLVAGPPHAAQRVLLLHGYGSGPSLWKLVGALDALAAAGVRAVAPELPGLAQRGAAAEAPILHGSAGQPEVAVDAAGPAGAVGASSTVDRREFVARLLESLGWQDASVNIVAASAGGSFATPYVLSPKHFRHVAGYVSLAAALDQRGYVAPSLAQRKKGEVGAESVRALLLWGALDNAFPPDSLAAQAQVDYNNTEDIYRFLFAARKFRQLAFYSLRTATTPMPLHH